MYEPMEGDRVVISQEGKAVKARVKSVAFGKVVCTTSATDTGSVHQIGDVVPLYRWKQIPCGDHHHEALEPLMPIGGINS